MSSTSVGCGRASRYAAWEIRRLARPQASARPHAIARPRAARQPRSCRAAAARPRARRSTRGRPRARITDSVMRSASAAPRRAASRFPAPLHAVPHRALEPRDRRQPAHVRDVGRLRRPRRGRADARRDPQRDAALRARRVFAVREHLRELRVLRGGQRARRAQQVHPARLDARRAQLRELRQRARPTRRAERSAAEHHNHVASSAAAMRGNGGRTSGSNGRPVTSS